MYRVVTHDRNGSARPGIEQGPWHVSHKTATYWADILRDLGYETRVESQSGTIHAPQDDNSDLASALASMA